MSRPVLAVFGGSFDPPHLGHALVPSYLRLRGLADLVLVVPVWSHALGKELTDFEARMTWTRAAMAPHGEAVVVSDLERRLARSEAATGYALDLLRAVTKENPDYRVRLVVGADIVETGETERWHQWDLIEVEFEPIIIPRAGFSDPGEVVLPEISSTEVRTWLSTARGTDAGAGAARAHLRRTLSPAVLQRIAHPGDHVLVVGSGNMATHGARWLRDRGRRVTQVRARAEDVDESLRPDAIWILVRDDAIEAVTEQVLERLQGIEKTTVVLHAAGSRLASAVLRTARERGHSVATLHPIFSARSEHPWGGLDRAWFGIEGDDAAVAWARDLVGESSAVSLQSLDAPQRASYHASCALVANHLAVLLEEGRTVWRELGIDGAHTTPALTTLMASAIENLSALGVPGGVSGPVARGDRTTVEAHLESLSALTPGAHSLYAELAKRLERIMASDE